MTAAAHICRVWFSSRYAFTFLLTSMVGQVLVSQTVKGKVIDDDTGEPIPYISIGIPNSNSGVISREDGSFELQLPEDFDVEALWFSHVAYEKTRVNLSESDHQDIRVALTPRSYSIPDVEVRASKRTDLHKLGRFKSSKTTTGQDGLQEYGWGGEWGTLIVYENTPYQIHSISFHTRFNSLDSLLFRINIYQIKEGEPAASILKSDLFARSVKGDKWITVDCLERNLWIEEDVIVTMEPVRFWYHKKGSNNLFYTHGKGYSEGTTWSRKSSFAPWEIDKRPPLAMYLTVSY